MTKKKEKTINKLISFLPFETYITSKSNLCQTFFNFFTFFYKKEEVNYLTSTVAPASSSLALISSASATEMFSLTTPLASTISLDSFKPKPVISLTTLITATLAAPASAIDTLTVDGAASA